MRKISTEAMQGLNGGKYVWKQCPICAKIITVEYGFNFLLIPEFVANMQLMNEFNAHYYSHGLNAK